MQFYKRAYTNLTARSVTGLLHQLDSTFRSRLDSTSEGFRVSDGTSCVRSAFSYHHDCSRKTYRTAMQSNSTVGIWGFPSSSKAGPMSNTDTTQAMTRYAVRRARCLPGQILGIHEHNCLQSRRVWTGSLTSFRCQKPYLRD